MSMSTHIIAFRPPDEKFQRMKAAFDACVAAGIDPPQELWAFFNGETPSEEGVEIDISNAVYPWGEDTQEGYQVDLSKLPKDVKYIRFYNSF